MSRSPHALAGALCLGCLIAATAAQAQAPKPPRTKKASAAAPAAPKPPAADAAPAPGPDLDPAPVRTARLIPLDETQARVFHTVIVHPSIPAVIEFPEAFSGTPSCGDCVDLTSPPEVLASADALFGVQVFAAEQYVLVKPAQYALGEGGRVPTQDFLTTLTVRLASRLTITLRVQYGGREEADGRVVFTLPNRASESAFVADQVKKAREELEVAFAERLEASVRTELLRLFLQPHQCTQVGRRERKDNVIVEVKELCRFGARALVRFSVENRHRSLLHLGGVDVLAGSGKDAVPVEAVTSVFEDDATEVPFQKTVLGVAGFEVPEGGPESFQLSLKEDGGKGRVVLVSDVRP